MQRERESGQAQPVRRLAVADGGLRAAAAHVDVRRRRRVAAEAAARLREGVARLLHHRAPARSLAGGLEALPRHATPDIQDKEDSDEVQVGGIVSGYKEWPLKIGRRAHGGLLSSRTRSAPSRWPASPSRSPRTSRCSSSDEPILVTGKVKPGRMDEATRRPRRPRSSTCRRRSARPAARTEKTKQMMVELPADALTEEIESSAQGGARECRGTSRRCCG